MINFLYKWQTLVGSFIGGIVGLLSALLVAYKERIRDEKASAFLLTGDLTVFIAAASAALKNDSGNTINVAYHFSRRPPLLSTLFDASLARVMHVDPKGLDAHLFQFKTFYSNIQYILDRLTPLFNMRCSNTQMEEDADKLVNALKSAIKAAEFSTYFLDELFLKRCAWWTRLTLSVRRRFYPTSNDIKSEELLRNPSTN